MSAATGPSFGGCAFGGQNYGGVTLAVNVAGQSGGLLAPSGDMKFPPQGLPLGACAPGCGEQAPSKATLPGPNFAGGCLPLDPAGTGAQQLLGFQNAPQLHYDHNAMGFNPGVTPVSMDLASPCFGGWRPPLGQGQGGSNLAQLSLMFQTSEVASQGRMDGGLLPNSLLSGTQAVSGCGFPQSTGLNGYPFNRFLLQSDSQRLQDVGQLQQSLDLQSSSRTSVEKGKWRKPRAEAGKGTGMKQLGSAPSHSNLFVAGLPEDATEEAVRGAFSVYGVVVSCRVIVGNSRRCALVKMGSVQEAQMACSQAGLEGLQVKMADSDISTRDSGGFRGEKHGKDALRQPSDNLYVKGLRPRITESQLVNTFAKAGKVLELKIFRYSDSQEAAALIRMGSVEDAQRAIEMLQGTCAEGSASSITVKYHVKGGADSDNLYVRGLPLNLSKDAIDNIFGQWGVVKRSRILIPPKEQAAVDTAALVQMATPEQAATVIQVLHGRQLDNSGPTMQIRFAEQRAAPNPQSHSAAPTDHLHVRGIPLGTPEIALRGAFGQFGTVQRLKVSEPTDGETTDCSAWVQMSSPEEATEAMRALSGSILPEQHVSMRVRYSGKDQVPGSNLYVAGLPLNVQEHQVRECFARCGSVVRLRLLVQKGRSETHALVQMSSQEEAEIAIQQLQGSTMESLGSPLVIKYATGRGKGQNIKEPRPGVGRGGKGQGKAAVPREARAVGPVH